MLDIPHDTGAHVVTISAGRAALAGLPRRALLVALLADFEAHLIEVAPGIAFQEIGKTELRSMLDWLEAPSCDAWCSQVKIPVRLAGHPHHLAGRQRCHDDRADNVVLPDAYTLGVMPQHVEPDRSAGRPHVDGEVAVVAVGVRPSTARRRWRQAWRMRTAYPACRNGMWAARWLTN